MITMIGTGHVFRISEQVTFIVKHTWPDAVLVELDEKRFAALTCEAKDPKAAESHSKLYREAAEYQNRVSGEHGGRPGDEMVAAINAGRNAGATIICIDKDAEQTMKEVEDGMSFAERTRYSLSGIRGGLFRRNKSDSTQKSYAANEDEYVRKMRKRFPTLVEKLIDERNVHMAGRIREISVIYKNIVVVVGDAHVRGLCELLSDVKVEKIRLADMMDQARMNEIRSRIWNKKIEGPQ
jgi:pheromone shutdown protein TraB